MDTPKPRAPFEFHRAQESDMACCDILSAVPTRKSELGTLSEEDGDYLSRCVAATGYGPHSPALARRIVAALNACRNVPTSWLEKVGGGPDGKDLFVDVLGTAHRQDLALERSVAGIPSRDDCR